MLLLAEFQQAVHLLPVTMRGWRGSATVISALGRLVVEKRGDPELGSGMPLRISNHLNSNPHAM